MKGGATLRKLFRFQQYLNAPEFKPRSTTKTPTINQKVYLNRVSVKIQDQEVLRSVSLDLEKGLLIGSNQIKLSGCVSQTLY